VTTKAKRTDWKRVFALVNDYGCTISRYGDDYHVSHRDNGYVHLAVPTGKDLSAASLVECCEIALRNHARGP
jgi:hypothetical protein